MKKNNPAKSGKVLLVSRGVIVMVVRRVAQAIPNAIKSNRSAHQQRLFNKEAANIEDQRLRTRLANSRHELGQDRKLAAEVADRKLGESIQSEFGNPSGSGDPRLLMARSANTVQAGGPAARAISGEEAARVYNYANRPSGSRTGTQNTSSRVGQADEYTAENAQRVMDYRNRSSSPGGTGGEGSDGFLGGINLSGVMDGARKGGNSAYDWGVKRLGLSEAGAAAPDFAGKSIFGGAKEAFAYMNRGSGSDVAKKWGTYAGAAVGTRMMTGGGVTYNNSGQRDIAGIPFV